MENTTLFGWAAGPPTRGPSGLGPEGPGSSSGTGRVVDTDPQTIPTEVDLTPAEVDLTRFGEAQTVRGGAGHPESRRTSTAVAPPGADQGGDLTLPAVPRGVPLSRQLVREICYLLDLGEVADVAELLASEVVTNAVRHAHTDCLRVVVQVSGTELKVTVADNDSRPPVLRRPAANSLGGRGLHLLDSLAEDWGVTEWPEGKAVWFSLSTEAE